MPNKLQLTPVIKQIIKLVISAVLLVIIFLKFDFSNVLESLTNISFKYIFAAFIIYIVSILLFAAKWRVLLFKQPYFYILKLTIIGLFYSMVIPGQIAGDGIKAYKIGNSWFSVVLDKYIGFIVIILLSIIGLLFTKIVMPMSIVVFFFVLFFCLLIFPFLIKNGKIKMFLENIFTEISRKSKFFHKACEKIFYLIHASNFKFDLKKIVLNILIGIIYFIISTTGSMILAKGAGFYISMFDWFWINGFLSVIILIPITIGGLGLREGSLIQLLGLFSIQADKVLSLSLIGFSFQLFFVILGGILEVFDNIRKATSH